MSWPDDPYAFEELLGQCGTEALEFLAKGKVAIPADEDGTVRRTQDLTPTSAAYVAGLVGRTIVGGDLSDLEGDKLGGVQLYETRKVTEAVKSTLTKILGEFHAEKKLVFKKLRKIAKPEPAAPEAPEAEGASEGEKDKGGEAEAEAEAEKSEGEDESEGESRLKGKLRGEGDNESEYERDEAVRLCADVYSSQGRRSQMEDRHTVLPDLNAYLGITEGPPQSFFAVYDGHGGVEAAKFCQSQLHHFIAQHPDFGNKEDTGFGSELEKAVCEGIKETDARFLAKSERDALSSGATAVVALLRGTSLFCAWLGDSQMCVCVCVCDELKAEEVMQPHKPEREDEKKRIQDAGGVVVWYGAWRVNGVLSVARAVGDRKLKQYVIGVPDINKVSLSEASKFIVLACDGLWDVMDSPALSSFLSHWTKKNNGRIQGVSKALVEHCICDLGASDNISVVVVQLLDLSLDTY